MIFEYNGEKFHLPIEKIAEEFVTDVRTTGVLTYDKYDKFNKYS